MARARLFVALDLPEDVRTALAAWGAREVARDPEALRLVRPEGLHVTLCFLGYRPEEEIPEIADIVADRARPAGELAIAGGAWLPPRRPGVLVSDVADPSGRLADVQASLAGALEAAGYYTPERRAFRPHVTVARVRRGARPRRRDPEDPPAQAFAGQAIRLYRSIPGPGGSRYLPVGT
jgi:RNA 2',3'-cyclic 3'-phosphodiesterase